MCGYCCWIIRATLLFGCGVAADTCYPPGGVAGIVVATIIVTCVVGGLGAALVWKYWWTPRHDRGQLRSQQGQSRQIPKNSSDFAFDNPYFRQQETDEAEKGKNKFSMNNKNSLRSSKQSENSKGAKKGRGGKNHFGFGGGKKQKAQDDSCLGTAEPERTFVSLRGHDFTGLGFNICGNMREGILVKDVLHRGPASESGLIKAGDKIINVTVSFEKIVYEDALTILSYASPYDVQLEIERLSDKSRITPSGSKRLGSCSFNNSGQKLFHPLYRSQSIDDLTQIDKDTFPSHGIGPRRSQSVGVAAHKLASHFKNSESKLEDKERNPVSLILSTTGSLNEKMLANVMAEGGMHKGLQWEKRFEDTLESDDSESQKETVGKDQITGARCQENKVEDSKRYLDIPHSRMKLETRKVDMDRDISNLEENRKGKTLAEISVWQINTDEDGSDQIGPRRMSKRDEFSGPKNLPALGRLNRSEEDNDSDVSKDSLEMSYKGYQKRKKPHSLDVTENAYESQYPNASSRSTHSHPQKELTSALKNSGQKSETQSKCRTERPTRIHSNSLSSNEEQLSDKEKASYCGAKYDSTREVENVSDSSDYERVRDMQSRQAGYRSAPKPSGSGHSERQKLSSPESFTHNYGCTKSIIVNGGVEDHKNKMAQTSKYNQNNHSSYSKSNETDNRRKDTETKAAESGSSSSQQQKFFKKSMSPAGGMFTQINPFQMPSKQKNATFKPWAGREDLTQRYGTTNDGELEFSASPRHSYVTVSESSGQPPKFILRDSAIKHRQF